MSFDTITYRSVTPIDWCAVDGCQCIADFRIHLGLVGAELPYCTAHLEQLMDTKQSGWKFVDGDARSVVSSLGEGEAAE